MKRDSLLIGCALGALSTVFLTALAVGLLLSGHWFYSLEIDTLNIEGASGLSKEAILENYDAVISFLSPFSREPFSMPGLAASAGGINHFNDVKAIVNGLYAAGLTALAGIALLAVLCKNRIGKRCLLAASITSFALPAAAGGGIALDFDGFFVLFHKLFFTNDDWLFDYVTDPVINILPARYFMHCGIIIAAFWVLGGVLFFCLFRLARRNGRQRTNARPVKYKTQI